MTDFFYGDSAEDWDNDYDAKQSVWDEMDRESDRLWMEEMRQERERMEREYKRAEKLGWNPNPPSATLGEILAEAIMKKAKR